MLDVKTILSPFEITEEEKKFVEWATQCEEFMLHPVWKKIETLLSIKVEEALDGCRGNQSSDPMVAHRLNLRWREREHLVDCVTSFLKGPIKGKKEFLEEIERLKGETNHG